MAQQKNFKTSFRDKETYHLQVLAYGNTSILEQGFDIIQNAFVAVQMKNVVAVSDKSKDVIFFE